MVGRIMVGRRMVGRRIMPGRRGVSCRGGITANRRLPIFISRGRDNLANRRLTLLPGLGMTHLAPLTINPTNSRPRPGPVGKSLPQRKPSTTGHIQLVRSPPPRRMHGKPRSVNVYLPCPAQPVVQGIGEELHGLIRRVAADGLFALGMDGESRHTP